MQDTEPPPQASFVVPNLGVLIVPLAYGDHHSWNLCYLAGKVQYVPVHWHHDGVEIHLSYNPTQGVTVLSDYRARVDEGYAKPIPPGTDHGWVNTGARIHHVPFIFGSLKHGGWGVFLDVEPTTQPVGQRPLVDRESGPFSQMIYLERHITQAKAEEVCRRRTLIPASATDRNGSGGLELNLSRIDQAGYSFPTDDFRIVSVVHGEGLISIEGIEREVRGHDHFGIPAGMQAMMKQTGTAPLVALDSLIRGSELVVSG